MDTRYIFTMEDTLVMQDVRDMFLDNEEGFDNDFPYSSFVEKGRELTTAAKTQAVFDCMQSIKKHPNGMFFRCVDLQTEKTKSYYSGIFMEGNLQLVLGGMLKGKDGVQAGYRFSEQYCRDRYNYYLSVGVESQTMHVKKPSATYDHAVLSITSDSLYRTFNRYEETPTKDGFYKLDFFW